MADLYEEDIAAWAARQAELLRRRASNELDWDNIAEEIADLGNEQQNAVESLLTNTIQHLLQIATWPQAQVVPHWRHEVAGWRVQIRRRLKRSPGLRGKLDLADLYSDACEVMYREVDGIPLASGPPSTCPWTLEQVLDRTFWPGLPWATDEP
jgi:hypothetical protein